MWHLLKQLPPPLLSSHYCYVISTLGLLLNGYLIYAILRRTPAELRVYRVVLANIVLCDFMAAFGNFWLQPVPSSSMKEVTRPANDSGISYVIMGPVVYFIHPATNHLLTCCFVGIIQYGMLAVPLSFAYRYLQVCHRNIAQHAMQLWIIVPVFSCLFLIAAAAAVCMRLGDMPKEGVAALVASWSEYYTHFDDDPDQPMFGNLIHLDWHVYLTIYIFLAMFILGYSMLILCAALIVRGLRRMQRNQSISQRTMRLQKRLTYCLMTQSLLPILFGGTPITMIAVTIGFGLYTKLVTSLAMAIYSYQQIFGPALTVLFIPSYRYGSKRWKENASKLINPSSHSKEPASRRWLSPRNVVKVTTTAPRRQSQPQPSCTLATVASDMARARAVSTSVIPIKQ
ncbi:unnamed protein product, partial [Mesorhabditis spiculigera]